MIYSPAPVSNLYWLNDIRPEHYASVGCKAFYLSQLLQKGHPVVPGFVVSASVLRSFLGTLNWANPLFSDLPASSLHLDVDNAQQLQAIAHQFRNTIEEAHFPDALLQELESAIAQLESPTWILRPSLIVEPPEATSDSPLQNTGLNFRTSSLFNSQICHSDQNSLIQALKRIWSDFLSARSLFYWQRMRTQLNWVNLAVLVQPVQSAVASGTLRTVDDHVEVCATVGLGMAIAWGEVTPDTYLIDSETGTIQSKQLGQKNIGYGLSGIPVANNFGLGSLNLRRDQKDAENPLEMYLLSDEEQATFALTKAHVHQLVHLHQRIVAEMRTDIELEWVLLQQGTDIHQIHLTQFILHHPKLARTTLSQSPQSSAHPKQSRTETLELFPGSTLVATGLPASPGQVLAQASVITHPDDLPTSIPPHTILVTSTMPLDWMPLLQTAAALIIEQGGMTSHCAIVARELGIPAVMGLSNITQQIRSGELLWVDGDRGKIYRLTQGLSDTPTAPINQEELPASFNNSLVTSSTQALRTELMVNANNPIQLPTLSHLPIKGVGLLRGELMALSILDSQHPLLWLQQNGANEFVKQMANAIRAFAEAFNPHPIFYRTFDLRSHEFFQLAEKTTQNIGANPMLGIRGTFSYLVDPTLFDLELRALASVQQSGYDNVHLMLPFVRTVEEFQSCKHLIEQAGLTQNANFQLWIMAEVPSVLLLLEDYVKAGVQGISIGTNDLTQLLLGVDRDQSQLAIAFDERHPAVKRAIAQLIRNSQELGIPCSVCGEAPVRYPELIHDLISWGITSISVAPNAIDSTYKAIAQAEQELLPKLAPQHYKPQE